MFGDEKKITISARVKKRDKEDTMMVGDGSFSKGFEIILNHYRDSGLKDFETERHLESLHKHLTGLEKKHGNSDLMKDKLEIYWHKYKTLCAKYEDSLVKEADNVIDILEERLG